jgi:hypothetical protein
VSRRVVARCDDLIDLRVEPVFKQLVGFVQHEPLGALERKGLDRQRVHLELSADQPRVVGARESVRKKGRWPSTSALQYRNSHETDSDFTNVQPTTLLQHHHTVAVATTTTTAAATTSPHHHNCTAASTAAAAALSSMGGFVTHEAEWRADENVKLHRRPFAERVGRRRALVQQPHLRTSAV